MQISNNYTSPHFGSLKVRSEAKKILHTLSPEDAAAIKQAEKDLAKFTDKTLELTDNLEPKIYGKGLDIYSKMFHPVKPSSNELNITTIWDGSPLVKFRRKGQKYCLRFPFETKDEALEAYNKIKVAKTPIRQAIETFKLLGSHQIEL